MTTVKLYCINCEEEVFANDKMREHEIVRGGDSIYDPPEIDYCDFPGGFAFVPPPEFDMDEFINTIVPPTDEEIAQMEAG